MLDLDLQKVDQDMHAGKNWASPVLARPEQAELRATVGIARGPWPLTDRWVEKRMPREKLKQTRRVIWSL